MAASARPAAPPVVDSRGRPVVLDALVARGGEGAVYLVAQRPDLVAKLYHAPAGAEKAAKLAAMVRLANGRLQALAAWPVETLHDRPGGAVRGLLMPRVQGHRELHALYGPRTRLREFPDADFPFLVQAAANVARAFAVIHEHGHVIGDVNHGSVLVSGRATVRLVDCDSFQVHDGGRRYLCLVGVPTHTPPELQGRPFDREVRTPNHDAFGLAVLIFQLLFLGRHPYSGVFLGTGDLPLERAIREFRFAYGASAAARRMRQPPHTPALETATPAVGALFERAFGPEGAGPAGRPTARAWVDALDAVSRQLVVCRRHTGHHYPRALAACPWCAIEAGLGLLLFNVALPRGASPMPSTTSVDLEALWQQILAVPDPGPPPQVPAPASFAITPSAAAAAAGAAWQRRVRATRLVLWIAGSILAVSILALSANPAVGYGVGLPALIALIAAWVYRNGGISTERAAAERALGDARSAFAALEQRWLTTASNRAFTLMRENLEAKREVYRALPRAREQQLLALRAQLQQRQLTQYLDRHRIATATISGIGPGRVATLQSWNVETAADVTESRILAVPGFGPALTQRLLAWRRSVEARFVFDPRRGLDPADVAVVDREIAAKRGQLERELRSGLPRLQQAAQQIVTARATLYPMLQQASQTVAQAEADLRALSAR
ncbi:MAG TPA: hypothetical protein VFL91_19190 [Thermomicrobiales bacterium]|nr:hypothetical protein [Thermomicrobiales bacterium]